MLGTLLGRHQLRWLKPMDIQDQNIDIRSVKDLLGKGKGEGPRWWIENLISEGDQVVLAGPPKSGKSFLALQLAMAVVRGHGHDGQPWFLLPDFKLPPISSQRKVLFFSLEMDRITPDP